jgi:peptidoglycan/LPS O-acetylase OafA/YrhL
MSTAVNRAQLLSMFARVTTGGAYLPAVDGLRFLAITGVIFHHAVGYWTILAGRTYSSMTLLDRCVADVIVFGAYGVHLFFVLSGFILALPFCKAARGGNPVDLKKYFWRRVTRLEPPFLLSTVLFFVADVLTHKYALRDGLPHLWATLTYTHELFFGRGSTINNATWTLEVEVQFYLFMPLIARVLWLTPFVRRSLLVVAIVFFSLNGDWLPLEHKRTILRFAQYFLAGILLADLRTSGALQAGTSWIGDLPGLLAVAACPIVALLHHRLSHALAAGHGLLFGPAGAGVFSAAFLGPCAADRWHVLLALPLPREDARRARAWVLRAARLVWILYRRRDLRLPRDLPLRYYRGRCLLPAHREAVHGARLAVAPTEPAGREGISR